MAVGWIALIAALWLVMILLLVQVIGLSGRIRTLQLQVSSNPVGGNAGPLATAPQVGTDISNLFEEPVQSVGADYHINRVLLFLSSTCMPCRELATDMASADAVNWDGADVVLITDPKGQDLYADIGADRFYIQTENEISKSLGVSVSPFGLAVDQDGIVRSRTIPHSIKDVERLARSCNDGHPIALSPTRRERQDGALL